MRLRKRDMHERRSVLRFTHPSLCPFYFELAFYANVKQTQGGHALDAGRARLLRGHGLGAPVSQQGALDGGQGLMGEGLGEGGG